MVNGGEKGEFLKVDGRGELQEISIEIVGVNALAVAASLDLRGLAHKHIKRGRHGRGDLAIMEEALKKMRRNYGR